ncbi:MAG: HigA family addiction module antidote protein [Magnetococcales bacterium]|nr:HigA family addiction module antidote protein [Magnetococcales bacterium]
MGALNNQKQHYVANRPSRPPTHPGIIVRNNVLPALMLSVEQAAGELRVPPDLLSGILQGTHPVTPDMAIRLGKFCGNGHQFWLRMQEAHDLWQAQDRLREELAAIPCRQPPLAA